MRPVTVSHAGLAQPRGGGLQVGTVAQRAVDQLVYGEQSKYFYSAKGVGRASRILDNTANDEIQWFTLVNKRYDMPVEETSVPCSL